MERDANEGASNARRTLVICEKPDAARRISGALSNHEALRFTADGTEFFQFRSGSEEFVVCSALGHLYALADPFNERSVYPVFDAEWFPSDRADRKPSGGSRRIAAIGRLATSADRVVNACDNDPEGETIGFNVLRYACHGRETDALRAQFSTLTDADLVRAFEKLGRERGGLAMAGRARHFVDFAWGVNLSRALYHTVANEDRRRGVSIGRVQGPTLGFLAERERQIREFISLPYWHVDVLLESQAGQIVAKYERGRFREKSQATKVRDDCEGKYGVVAKVKEGTASVKPPPAFNLGDLQSEAYKRLGLSPSATAQAAQKLYLAALISYPRTDSQRLPRSIGYYAILRSLSGAPRYARPASEALRRHSSPVQGAKSDPAHPAIYPTGGRYRGRLRGREAAILDLVTSRFLAAFGQPTVFEVVSTRIDCEGHSFTVDSREVLSSGWMEGSKESSQGYGAPRLAEGQRVEILEVRVHETRDQKPPRYNQGTLLARMESESIGTKSTRADIISTLVSRGYATEGNMVLRELGFSVVENMKRHAPEILETRMTREIEGRLEGIADLSAGSTEEREMLRDAVRSISSQIMAIGFVGTEPRAVKQVVARIPPRTLVLARCPSCKVGELRVVRSRKSGKRFVGCSNYENGCRASAPLPQKGRVLPTAVNCAHCSWPIVLVIRRSRWRLCVNMSCPGRSLESGSGKGGSS